MKSLYVHLFLLSLLFLGLIQCQDSKHPKPKNLIEKDTFTSVLAEFQIINSANNSKETETLAKVMRDSVLSYYQISLQQFYDSEKYYSQDSKLYQTMLNKAMDKLNEEQAINVEAAK